jgi:integrase/recombinase XerC
VSADILTQFLSLHQSEAVYQVLQYRQLLIEAKLAPSTINVRLSALKSFVDYARLSILGKGKIQKSQVDLSPATIVAIAQWLAAREDYRSDDSLFTSLDRRSKGHRLDGSTIYRLVREFSTAAGIDKIVSPHRIRHSAITAYLDVSDGNIRAAQGLSRHANLNTLNRYDDNRHKYQAQATNTLADLV